MRGGALILLSCIAFASFAQCPESHSQRAEDTSSAQRELFQKYSVVCHNDRTNPLDAEYATQVKPRGPRGADAHDIEPGLDGQLWVFPIEPRRPPERVRPPAKGQANGMAKKNLSPQRAVELDDEAPEDAPANFFPCSCKAGPHGVIAVFLEKTEAEPETTRKSLRPAHNFGGSQSEPYIGSIMTGGPYRPTRPGDTLSRRRIFICHPSSTHSEGASAKRQGITADALATCSSRSGCLRTQKNCWRSVTNTWKEPLENDIVSCSQNRQYVGIADTTAPDGCANTAAAGN